MYSTHRFWIIFGLLLLLVGIANATTTTFNATYCAQPARTTDSTWTDLRNSAGTTVATGTAIGFDMQAKSTNTTPWDYYYRGGCTWDTSALPDTATISGATLTGYSRYRNPALGNPTMSWINFSPASATSYVAGDYDNTDWTRYTDTVVYNSFYTLNASIIWTLNSAGINNISKTGSTTMYLEPNWTIDNEQPTWITVAEGAAQVANTSYASGNFAPQLSITYTESPTAAFSANYTSGITPLAVGFTDTSTNTPTNWSWYFWDNETVSSTAQHPSTTFTTGSYSIRLNASNVYGYDWENKTGYIVVSASGTPPPLVINATYNKQMGRAPAGNDTIAGMRNGIGTVIASSTHISNDLYSDGTSPNFWYNYRTGVTWDTSALPDDAIITAANITGYISNNHHEFSTYPSIAWIDFTPAIPTSLVAADYNKTSYTVESDWINTSAYPAINGSIVWTLNSAGIANISKTGYSTFMYESSWIINDSGPTWAFQKEDYWGIRGYSEYSGAFCPRLAITYTTSSPSAPVAAFSCTPTSGVEPLDSVCSDASTNTPIDWDWYIWSNETKSSDLQSPSLIGLPAGTYNIRLNASNADGSDWENKTAYISVGGTYGSAIFYDIYDGMPWRSTDSQFPALRNGPGENLLESTGIGNDIQASNVTNNYLYNYRGGFTVNTSSIGATSTINSATITGIVGSYIKSDLGSPTYSWIDFNPANKSQYVAADYDKTTFVRMTDSINQSVFIPGYNYNVVWTITNLSYINKTGLTSFMFESSWMIDNTSPTWISYKETTASIRGIRYSNGTYKPYLTVNYTSTSGGVPSADFTANVTSGNYPLTVQFNDTSSNTPTSWLWDFGFGVTSTLQNPTHTYNSEGSYSIDLYATNAYGTDVESKGSYITVYNGTVGFTANERYGRPPYLAVRFTDMSTNNATAWAWYWFDNETVSSTVQNPENQFTLGTYDIRLYATGSPSGWHNKTDYISVDYAPTAHFNMTVV